MGESEGLQISGVCEKEGGIHGDGGNEVLLREEEDTVYGDGCVGIEACDGEKMGTGSKGDVVVGESIVREETWKMSFEGDEEAVPLAICGGKGIVGNCNDGVIFIEGAIIGDDAGIGILSITDTDTIEIFGDTGGAKGNVQDIVVAISAKLVDVNKPFLDGEIETRTGRVSCFGTKVSKSMFGNICKVEIS
jgi:hypothetical protein